MRPLRAVSALLAATIAVLPIAPREHVHETTAQDGHHELVAHRHASAHVLHSADHENPHTATFDDDDSVILTLDAVFTAPPTYVPQVPSLALVGIIQEPAAIERTVPPDFVERLTHGPPRALSKLRGPPASPLL